MKILFDQMPDTVLEHFNGGEGQFVAKMFNDGKCKILRGLLAPGCSIGMHTHKSNSEVIYVLSGTGKMLIDDGEEILTANRKELELTARYLLEHETMDAATFEKVFTQPDGEEFSTLSQENV